MSKAGAIFAWAKMLAPLVLGNIPATRPLAGTISHLMEEAEGVKTATGPEKLARVTSLTHAAGEALNKVRPGLVDLDALDGAVEHGITAAFEAAKIVAQAHPAPAIPPTVTT